MKVVFWVQSLLGSGHLHRVRAFATALAERGVAVTLLQGGQGGQEMAFPFIEQVRLPGLRAADATFSALVDAAGNPPSQALWAHRRKIIQDTLDRIEPDALVTEGFPFARRAFRHELLPILETARGKSRPPLILCSVRDVLVPKNNPKKERWMAETARHLYDQIILHGDQAIIPFDQTFPYTEQLRNLLFYSGYITSQEQIETPSHEGCDIIISGGGGAVAGPLFRQVLAAIALVPTHAVPTLGLSWRLLVGPDLPAADRQDLAGRVARAGAGGNIQLEPAIPNLARSLARARLSISQAGYNTIMDIIRSGVRSLVVPFAAGGESEQALRAGILARSGRLTLLAQAEAQDPSVLARAITTALGKPRPAPVDWRTDGAAQSAERVLSLIQERRRP